MRKRLIIKMATNLFIIISGIFIGINCALAEPVKILEKYNWRDLRGPNTVNFSVGDRLLFGADVDPPEGTTVKACQVRYNRSGKQFK